MKESVERCEICGLPIGNHRFVFEKSIEKVDAILSPQEFLDFLTKEGYELDEDEKQARLEEGKPETIISPLEVESLYTFCKGWEEQDEDPGHYPILFSLLHLLTQCYKRLH